MMKYCKDKEHKVLLVVVSGLKPGIIAQYTNQGAIIIPDGIAY